MDPLVASDRSVIAAVPKERSKVGANRSFAANRVSFCRGLVQRGDSFAN